MKKSLLPLAALTATILCASTAVAENKAETLTITPFIGGLHFDPMEHLDPALIYGGKIGYNFTERFGIEGVAEAGKPTTKRNDNINFLDYRLEGLYHFFPKKNLVPYLAAGYGGSRFKDNIQDRRAGIFDYGIGVKYFLNDLIAIRGDARHLIIKQNSTQNLAEYTLGLMFNISDASQPPPPVEPAPVQKVVEPAPAPAPKPAPAPAPAPAPVPKPAPAPAPAPEPAPTASLSLSPISITEGESATLSWVSQNSSDCSISPVIGPVQSRGSVIVAPTTNTSYTLSCSGKGGSAQSSTNLVVVPKPVVPQVVDTDMDGVPDNLDKCPDTPAGTKVDKNGCPPPVAKSCKNIRLAIEFDTGKADVKSKYGKEIKKISDFLVENPGSTAVIEGHTDDVGSADSNMKLSQRRADAVRSYLIQKFDVAPTRIEAKGFGETKPKASNKTAKGRFENRRVEAQLFCE